MAKRKKVQPGQYPMDFMLPESDWEPVSELPDLRGHDILACDLETKDDGLKQDRGAGWVYDAGHIAGVVLAAGDTSVYAPVSHPETRNFDECAVRRWTEDHLRCGSRVVFHKAAYDLGWLSTWGLDPPERIDDTQAMAVSLDENRLRYGLDAVCAWLGVPGKDEEALRQAAQAHGYDAKEDLWRMPGRYVGPYAEQDGRSTLEAARVMLGRMRAQDLLDPYRLEMELVPMVQEMRRRGIRIDVDRADQARTQLLGARDETLGELSRRLAIGRDVSISDLSSPAFMERVFDDAGIPYPTTPKTKRGSFSTKWMAKREHWLPLLATRALQMHDAGDKFVGKYILEFCHRGRLHSEVNQYRSDEGGTRTSRFSYSDPPLQQMPARNKEIKRLIRGLFLPEAGEVWCSADYSQQEYRLMAHFAYLCKCAGAREVVEMYREHPDTDFHQMVADMAQIARDPAKSINFGIAYGEGKAKLAADMGISVDEAVDLLRRVNENAPFVMRLSEFCQKRVHQRGHLRLLDGARSHFDDWEPRWVDREKVYAYLKAGGRRGVAPCRVDEARSRVGDPEHPWSGRLRRAYTHKAMNRLIQGSAARHTKLAMREFWREGMVPLVQMHDELNFSVASPEAAARVPIVMRDAVEFVVPMKVDDDYGLNWGEIDHTYEEAAALVRAAA